MRVFLAGGRAVLCDHPEASDGEDVDAGLYLAVDALGDARPLRWPSDSLRSGEALYRPHQLTCFDG